MSLGVLIYSKHCIEFNSTLLVHLYSCTAPNCSVPEMKLARCPNQGQGCVEEVRLGQVEEHISLCQHREGGQVRARVEMLILKRRQ